jgi:UDP:flavonoid glycosyltransferase YjiC (YdhE family)
VKSIIITHQLLIKTGFGNWIDKQLQKRLYKILQRFTNCWVPDFENDSINLAGLLSHPVKPCPIPVTYIGGLSRLRACINEKKKDYILCILSGPEPQRTIIENKILKEASGIKKSIVLVRGISEKASPISASPNVTVINYLDAQELNSYLCEADIVICRAGYTSVMDFASIGCKALLIPTPGQAEQEYLAKRLESIQFAPFLTQNDFSIKIALEKIACFNYQKFEGNMEQYEKTIPAALEALKG